MDEIEKIKAGALYLGEQNAKLRKELEETKLQVDELKRQQKSDVYVMGEISRCRDEAFRQLNEARNEQFGLWVRAMAELGYYGNVGLSPRENLEKFADYVRATEKQNEEVETCPDCHGSKYKGEPCRRCSLKPKDEPDGGTARVVAHCRKCKHSTFVMVDECDTCKKQKRSEPS